MKILLISVINSLVSICIHSSFNLAARQKIIRPKFVQFLRYCSYPRLGIRSDLNFFNSYLSLQFSRQAPRSFTDFSWWYVDISESRNRSPEPYINRASENRNFETTLVNTRILIKFTFEGAKVHKRGGCM